MDIATGAMNSLLPKLAELVVGEYKLQKGVKGEIKELEQELTSMTAALRKVAEVPPDQLDELVKIWARDVRELSYDIEDEVDVFMLSSKQEHGHTKPFSLKGLIGKATNLYKKAKTNHKIHDVIKDIMDQVKKVADRHDRYNVDNIVARHTTVTVDPRLEGMYRKATELVGIGQPKNELAKRLLEHGCSSSSSRKQPNIISIVGFGGLGKTTLANSLLQDLKSEFDCHVFVSVSLNPDIKRIFMNILLQLNDKKYSHIDDAWEMNQLIDKIVEFLKNQRCLCVIDDLWKESAWDEIKLPFQHGHPESKIIITTRNRNVAEYVGGGVYELKPLSDDDSRKLLHMRIYDTEDGFPPSLVQVTGKILKKCGGVPLAIITIASLLARKPTMEWEEVNKSIGSGLGNSLDVDKMRKILSLSYNDLPFHLKTCLMSLSKYPEDHLIRKDVVVWSWIAEGFIKLEETQGPGGKSLQEIAESYFNDLINRSLIRPVQKKIHDASEQDGQVHYCQMHDMVLELINQLSAEEGFVTTLLSADDQQTSTLTSAMQKRKIRRLSLNKNSSMEVESYVASSSKESREQLSKVRSLDIFGKVKSIPPLPSFHVLRVLQVHECSGLDSNRLNDLGKLRLLRFLRLYGLNVTKLPNSIGDLESLETLNIRGLPEIEPVELPLSFGKLRKLVRLVGSRVKLPDGLTLENMTSLRELRGICGTVHAVTEIGRVKGLKVLELLYRWSHSKINILPEDKMNETIVNCLQSLPSLQVFILRTPGFHCYPVDLMARLPSGLRTFTNFDGYFRAFPEWTKPQLSYLTVLHLRLRYMCALLLPEHLEQLAELPSLRFLLIELAGQLNEQEELSSASGFPCLTHLDLSIPLFFIKFQQGAMPKLQKLHLQFGAPTRSTIERLQINTYDCGLDKLPSLQHLVVRLHPGCPEEMAVTIRKAVSDHPNHPSLDLYRERRHASLARITKFIIQDPRIGHPKVTHPHVAAENTKPSVIVAEHGCKASSSSDSHGPIQDD